jgi:hypothetical protein
MTADVLKVYAVQSRLKEIPDMFFVKHGGNVYHIMTDVAEGLTVCGHKVSRIALTLFKAGRETENISRQRPERLPLCKHCQKGITDHAD